jgi:hypothetical protein
LRVVAIRLCVAVGLECVAVGVAFPVTQRSETTGHRITKSERRAPPRVQR